MLLSWLVVFFFFPLQFCHKPSGFLPLKFSHGSLWTAFEATSNTFSLILLMCLYRFFQKWGLVLVFLFLFVDWDMLLQKGMETTVTNFRLSEIEWFSPPQKSPISLFFLWKTNKMLVFLHLSTHFTQIIRWQKYVYEEPELIYFSTCTLPRWSSYSCILLAVPWHYFLFCIFLGVLSKHCFLLHPSYTKDITCRQMPGSSVRISLWRPAAQPGITSAAGCLWRAKTFSSGGISL